MTKCTPCRFSNVVVSGFLLFLMLSHFPPRFLRFSQLKRCTQKTNRQTNGKLKQTIIFIRCSRKNYWHSTARTRSGSETLSRACELWLERERKREVQLTKRAQSTNDGQFWVSPCVEILERYISTKITSLSFASLSLWVFIHPIRLDNNYEGSERKNVKNVLFLLWNFVIGQALIL